MPDFALDFDNSDLVKYAQSYGAFGHRIAPSDGLITIMEGAFKSSGVLIDALIDYS